MKIRSRENVSQMIIDNTIYDTLVNELHIYSIPDPNKLQSTIIVYEFPPWFSQHITQKTQDIICLLYTSPSPRDQRGSRMPSSA